MSAVKPDMTTAQANAARNAEINNISAEAGKKIGLRNDVIALYQGGQYNLYTYKKYTDVRLVFAPSLGMRFLGGARTNFNYRPTTSTSRCFGFTKTTFPFIPKTSSSGQSRARRRAIWFLSREIPAARTGLIQLRTLNTCAILAFRCC